MNDPIPRSSLRDSGFFMFVESDQNCGRIGIAGSRSRNEEALWVLAGKKFLGHPSEDENMKHFLWNGKIPDFLANN